MFNFINNYKNDIKYQFIIMRKPNFFIVGQTRSGTSTLFAQLKQHPDVYIVHSGRGDLLPFFGFYPKIRTEEEYLETHYANAKDEKRVGEKSTDNLMSQTSASKIHQYYPDAKIITVPPGKEKLKNNNKKEKYNNKEKK